jgi:antitoxin VapB
MEFPVALNLKDPQTDRLAREVATLTGESLTGAIRKALAERLARERRRRGETASLSQRLAALGRECSALPDIDRGDPDALAGYDAHGLWA